MNSIINTLGCLLLAFMVGCASTSRTNFDTINQYERAIEAYKAGRFSDAEPLLISLLNKYPDFAEGWYRLGNLYVRTGQNEAAINAYNKCVKYDPNFSKAWHNLSLVHLKVAIHVLEEGMGHSTDDNLALSQLRALRNAMMNVGAEGRQSADSQATELSALPSH